MAWKLLAEDDKVVVALAASEAIHCAEELTLEGELRKTNRNIFLLVYLFSLVVHNAWLSHSMKGIILDHI